LLPCHNFHTLLTGVYGGCVAGERIGEESQPESCFLHQQLLVSNGSQLHLSTHQALLQSCKLLIVTSLVFLRLCAVDSALYSSVIFSELDMILYSIDFFP